MDDFNIDLLLSETNSLEDTLSLDSLLQPIEEKTMSNHTQSSTLVPLMEQNSSTYHFSSTKTHLDSSIPVLPHPLPSPINNLIPYFDDVCLDPSVLSNEAKTSFTNKNCLVNELPLQNSVIDGFPINSSEVKQSIYFRNLLMSPNDRSPSINLSTNNLNINAMEQFPPLYNLKGQSSGYFTSLLMEDLEHQPSVNKRQDDKKKQVQLPSKSPSPRYSKSKIYPSEDDNEHVKLSSKLGNSMDEVINNNREAVTSFLSGVVRPGPDVTRIYKCNVCSVEFSNPQAFGGHMSSHGRRKRDSNIVVDEERNLKKAKMNNQSSSNPIMSTRKIDASEEDKIKNKDKIGTRRET